MAAAPGSPGTSFTCRSCEVMGSHASDLSAVQPGTAQQIQIRNIKPRYRRIHLPLAKKLKNKRGIMSSPEISGAKPLSQNTRVSSRSRGHLHPMRAKSAHTGDPGVLNYLSSAPPYFSHPR